MVQKANTVFRDFVTDGIPSSGENDPDKAEIRKWGTYVENGLMGATAGATIYDSKGDMEADTSQAANAMAWVLGDDTAANNGIYQFDGTSTWTRLGDLPYGYIKASNAGAGTANAIQATTSVPVPAADGGALIALPIVADTTASPVTVSFNGGAALTVKTASGNDPAVGGLKAGITYDGYVSGSGTIFQLRTDQASAAIVAQTEAVLAEFQTIYLGAFSTANEPTTDLEGNALIAGAEYFNTDTDTRRIWTGTEWQDVAAVPDGSVTDAKVSGLSKLYNRIHDLPSVKDFGAIGDGVEDDTAALQAALDDDRVYMMPPGRYRTTAPLVSDPTRNRGNGFVGLTTISLYPDLSQGNGPDWDGTNEAVIWYDGPSDDDLTGTSSSSVTIGTGAKSLTTDASKAFDAGMEIVVRRTSSPNDTYLYGTVTSYDDGTGALVVDVDGVAGSGTFSDWSIKAPTAVLAVKAGVPLTVEPAAAFDTTPYGFTLHQIICHGNEKAQYGFYSVRLQDGNLFNVIGYRCKEDGLYINGSYSGNYNSLLGYRNWGRGVSLGAADYDYGWTAQGAINRVTFIDTWGYNNGRAGDYDQSDPDLRLRGCGIFFGPHRGSSLIGWTAELNDGVGLVYAPTSQSNIIFNGYTELNSSNDITGSGSAVSTGRATEQRGVLFYGAAGGGSWGNQIDGLYMANEKLWLSGSEPSTARAGLIVKDAVGSGTVAGWENYNLENCAVELVDTLTGGNRPHSHGTWTPVLQGATTAGTQTYSVQMGTYEIINDVMTAHFTIVLSSFDGTTAGNLEVSGLPFAAKAFPSSNMKFTVSISEFILKAGSTGRPVAFVTGGSSVITLRYENGTGSTNTSLTPALVDGTFRLAGEVRYRVR